MQTLKNILQEIKSDFTVELCNRSFHKIAELLINSYAVQNDNKIFRMTDIEFYFYGPNINDERVNLPGSHVTYERTTPAGYWFFHDSGIDISFKSDKEEGYGGGILIRGIKQILPNEYKAVDGPKKCYWELFDDCVSAFENTSPNPHLINFEFVTHPDIHNSLRVGLSQKEKNPRMWRYFIDVK